MYKLIIIFLLFSFCSSTSVEDDSIVPQQNNENNNSSVSNESQESLITTKDNEEIENFSDQEQLIEDEYIEELPEPIFIDITEIYEPFINEELLSETKEYAIKADVEELLVYLDDILLFKLPEHIVEEIGGGIAWYVSKNTYTTWDGEPNAQDIDFGAFNTLGYVNALNAFPKRLEAIAKVVRYGSGSYHGTFWTTDASICNDTPVIGAFENIDGVQTLVTGSETTPPDVKALQVGWGFGDSGLIPEVRNIDGADVTVSPGYACEADLSVMLGEEVLFVEEGSTSGYLYPSLQLKNAGIDYKNDITQVFAGSHDGVIAGLYNGDAKFGVSYDDARRTLRKTNPDVGEKVIAFSITAEIPNDVVAVRSDLPADVKEKIYTILSDYISTEEGQAVMDEIYGWTDIVPAVNSEFDVVKQAAEEFGLYDE
jgi:ABC-type phosphate/phosphonate transport system substrate-binding protein